MLIAGMAGVVAGLCIMKIPAAAKKIMPQNAKSSARIENTGIFSEFCDLVSLVFVKSSISLAPSPNEKHKRILS